MRWIKANSSSKHKDKKKRNKEDEDSSTKTVIVFNPLLWKEEIVNLIEDWLHFSFDQRIYVSSIRHYLGS